MKFDNKFSLIFYHPCFLNIGPYGLVGGWSATTARRTQHLERRKRRLRELKGRSVISYEVQELSGTVIERERGNIGWNHTQNL